MKGLAYFPPYSEFRKLLPAAGKSGAVELKTFSGGDAFLLASYDLKNQFEDLTSQHSSAFHLHPLEKFSIGSAIPLPQVHSSAAKSNFKIKARTSKETYISNVKRLQDHIHRGDIYEINYCIEFFAEHVELDPFLVFGEFASISEAPFSFYAQINNLHILCASPERFLKKTALRLISQPIKGTRRRSKDPVEDQRLAYDLKNDPKERTENVMIVDLVRNDLSRIARKASVHVDELFGVYSFRQVHQMISTVSCNLRTEDLNEILKATFPMGSMTGAPKIRAMELSDQYEDFNRGLYSGSAGILNQNGDFDLNVMIRSIFYDETTKYLSFSVGSAITAFADPLKEYEECLVKAKAMFLALGCEDQWNKLSNE